MNLVKKNNINIKQFYSFFTYDKLFSKILIPDTSNLVTAANLRLAMKRISLIVSNSTLRYSKEGSPKSNIASYNFEKAFKRAIKEEIILTKIFQMKTEDKSIIKNEGDLNMNMQSYKKYFDNEMKEDINLKLIN